MRTRDFVNFNHLGKLKHYLLSYIAIKKRHLAQKVHFFYSNLVKLQENGGTLRKIGQIFVLFELFEIFEYLIE